ncbi:urate oxidase [Rhizopus delemar RA 99-880]|uniref:Uricase n=1 Tax=Rhizopus delemar (strain RA 99-880 / ATCC MYA-4621 / FGSC 9543 / NRRL 43880) TaxID=246409 RepID=I1BH43_RHIO9|nr:urate oxidase [Rhizopus delemar RA 99-880]|eukprot:EIE75523.1 urate oxidase [Rhizopus delemar RA 99-880]
MTVNSNVYLKHARYGKDLVRLLRVYKEGDVQHCTELTVRLLLEGDIETSYTKADNSVVVATAKKSDNVDNIELFGQEITKHVLKQYAHISGAFVDIIKHKWTRMIVDGKPHNHSFLRDGEDIQTTSVHHYRVGNKIHITSGLQKLLVLKTTGSAFHGFYKDEYTTLVETWDRIFSTSVDAKWTFSSQSPDVLSKIDYKKIHAGVRQITCDTFAKDDSASVQATLYLMQQQILTKYPEVAEVSYALPNKHYVGIDLSKFNIDNTGKNTSLYYPQADPSGLITAVAGRKDSKL